MIAFLSYVHSFSDIAILFSVLIVTVVAACLAPFIGNLLIRLRPSEDRYAAALDGFKAIASILGVLVAFSLVQANSNVRLAEEQVAKEAALAQSLDRALLRSGREDFAAIRPLLDAYLHSRIEEEWPMLSHGDRSDATDEVFSRLSKAVRALSPADARQTTMYGEIIKSLDDMADMRELTIEESDPTAFSLGAFYWIAISAFCGIGFFLALFARPSLASVATLGAATSAVALMLAMLIIVDQPFQGETSVSPSPLEKAQLLDSRRV